LPCFGRCSTAGCLCAGRDAGVSRHLPACSLALAGAIQRGYTCSVKRHYPHATCSICLRLASHIAGQLWHRRTSRRREPRVVAPWRHALTAAYRPLLPDGRSQCYCPHRPAAAYCYPPRRSLRCACHLATAEQRVSPAALATSLVGSPCRYLQRSISAFSTFCVSRLHVLFDRSCRHAIIVYRGRDSAHCGWRHDFGGRGVT